MTVIFDLLPALLAAFTATAPLDLAAGSALGAGAFGAMGAGSLTAVLSGTAITGFLGNAAVSVGLSYLAQALAPKPSADVGATMQTLNEPTAPRMRVYGRRRIGGVRLLWGNASGHRVSVVAHCQGPISGISEVWYGDELCEFSVGGAGQWGVVSTVNSPTRGQSRLQSFKGTGSQSASSFVTGLVPSWGTGCRARGIAYTALAHKSVKVKAFTTIYKAGEPTMTAVIDGSPLWDPRDPGQNANDAWDGPATWDETSGPVNAGLAILDFIRHPDGRSKPLSRIDLDTFKAFADLCAEAVPLKHGGTTPRYTLSGYYYLTEEPANVQAKMLAACDGDIYMTPAGKIGIRGGKMPVPTITLKAEWITGANLKDGTGRLVAFNRQTVTYVSPSHDYQPVEAEAWVDEASVSLYGQLETSTALDFVSVHAQARRLAKIKAKKSNPSWSGTIKTSIEGLDAITEEAVYIELSPGGGLVDGVVFLIKSWSLSADLASVTFDVGSIAGDAYDWDAATEEGEPPPVAIDISDDNDIAAPTVTSVAAYNGGIKIVVAAPEYDSYTLFVEWALTGSGDWANGYAEAGATEFWTGVLTDGATYDLRASWLSASGAQGDLTTAYVVPIVYDPTAPGAPTVGTASVSSGTVTVPATAPNSPNVVLLRFYRGTTTFGAATALTPPVFVTANQSVALADVPGTGTWKYWCTAENGSGVASAEAGPATATVP